MSKNSQASITAPPASRRDTIFGHVFLLASHLLYIVLPLLHAQHLFHDKRKTTFWFSLHCYLQVRVFMDALTCAIKFTTPSIWKELSKDIMSHLAPCSLKPHTFKVLTNFLSACAFFTRLDFVVYANSITENRSILTCMGTKSNMMVEFLDAKLLIRGNVFVVLYGVGTMCQKSLDLIGRILHRHRVTSEKSNPLIR